MSECKKTCGNCAGLIRSVLSKDRCDITRNTIENYSSTCKDWEPNRDTEVVMQKDELKSLRKERDELQAQVKERELAIEKVEAKCCQCHVEHVAQVAVLRGALETATDYMYNPFEPDNQCAQYKNIKNILQTTPAEAAERVNALVMALEKLSRLGGPGGGYGNSDGNVIAQKALADWRRK